MSASIESVTVTGPAPSAAPKAAKPTGHLGFADLLDVLNPLQHIPVIGSIYRAITGDTMSPTAEILGGALYGGVIGAVGSIADVLFTQGTGKNFGDTVFAWLGFGSKNAATQLAKADAPVASLAVVKQAAANPAPKPMGTPGLPQLVEAMRKQGRDPGLAARAAFAYQSAIGRQNRAAVLSAPSY
jgi:hypothetical protein